VPVICLTQTIIKINELNLPNPVYSLQQDSWTVPEYTADYGNAILLTSTHNTHIFKDGYYYDQVNDLKITDKICSMISAIHVAYLFGCRNIVFFAFDAATDGHSRHPQFFKERYKDYDQLKNYLKFYEIAKQHLVELDIPYTFYRIGNGDATADKSS
jgi:hypothetical protein